MPIWLIIAATALYTAGLFYVAWRGDQQSLEQRKKPNGLRYSLALAVYCTSWTYFGAVGTAASSGWDYLWIYVGPALVFLLLPGLVRRIGDIVERENIISLSDFLAARYGKSRGIAALATFTAVMGSLPYISLQLKSLGMSFSSLAGQAANTNPATETVFMISIILALFAILFGARQTDITEQNSGLMTVLSVEAIIKLAALLAVAILSVNILSGDIPDTARLVTIDHFSDYSLSGRAITIMFLSTAAIICLPRQFHVAMIERQSSKEVKTAFWVFPLYLLITSIVVIPITLAGLSILPTGSSADLFVLNLPLSQGDGILALFVFLGGFSAATGMVIVSTVALSTMIANDIIFPLFFERNKQLVTTGDQASRLILIRRIVIFAIVILAYGYFRIAKDSGALAQIGLLSFAAAAQFFPILLGAVFWRHGNFKGAIWGLGVGIFVWFYTLFLPAFLGIGTLEALLPQWLNPYALLGFKLGDSLTHGVIWSIGLNTLVFIIVSIISPERLRDQVQAIAFTSLKKQRIAAYNPFNTKISDISPNGLRALASRFLKPEAVEHSFLKFTHDTQIDSEGDGDADWLLIQHTEKLMAKAIGASSARVILASVIGRKDVELDDILTIIDQTSHNNRFDHHMLQATLENINQGISVIDENQRLVAWNGVYVDIFNYPDQLLKVGTPIQTLIRHNIANGWVETDTIQMLADKRANHMRAGRPHNYERAHLDGRHLRIVGSPMPGGGYVTTFTDITEDKLREKALLEANETLEDRVEERTQELKAITHDLDLARAEAEGANLSKTRFLAAASHDLLQPLNAARLFLGAIDVDADKQKILDKVDQSIRSADDLLKGLLDISRLDHAQVQAEPQNIDLNTIFENLIHEATPMATTAGIHIKFIPTSLVVKADKGFLLSVLRNLLSNARRYTEQGGVILGARRVGDKQVRIEVWDTGPGLTQEGQKLVFEEFKRIKEVDNKGIRGAGLGLSISQRLAHIMDTDIHLKSRPGKGSVFSITLPRIYQVQKHTNLSNRPQSSSLERLTSLKVLCIDDETTILEAMKALLEKWDCDVTVSQTGEEAIEIVCTQKIDAIVADYQLGSSENGLQIIEHLRPHLAFPANVCLLTAGKSRDIERQAANDNILILNKPANPADIKKFLDECAGRSTL